jgi:MFS family permease
MKKSGLNHVIPIAAIFSFRMLGLFMLIPVFSIYATQLNAATPTLIGIALGSYGLSQGLLQIPFGILSDRFGRKPILTIGLVLFAVGSLFGAYTDSIYGMIIARIIQGMGAVGSVLIALLADLTTDEVRTKAMAIIGITIGLSFSLAMVISPPVTHYFGLSGIFYLTAILAGIGLFLLHVVIPTPIQDPFRIDTESRFHQFKNALQNRQLQRLNFGIFCQHMILTATFFAIPIKLQQNIKLGNLTESWHFYMPLMIFAFIAMVPFIIIAEKKQRMKLVFMISVAIIGVSQLMLSATLNHWYILCGLMFLYFVAFNVLEASLPSLVSRHASSANKGTAMGIYSSSQFLGIFAGGAISGIIYQYAGSAAIFMMNGIMAIIWFLTILKLQPNAYIMTLTMPYPSGCKDDTHLIQLLNALNGVKEVQIMHDLKLVYLKVDKSTYDTGSAEQIITNCSSSTDSV